MISLSRLLPCLGLLLAAGAAAQVPEEIRPPFGLVWGENAERLERMLGKISDWSGLSRLLPVDWSGGPRRRSALASTLLACLELARDGKLEIRQLKPFDEVYVKDRTLSAEA
ncbi:MAG: hypothetical protein ABI680_14085, partial [Chthoniobacteraceae bacterium]